MTSDNTQIEELDSSEIREENKSTHKELLKPSIDIKFIEWFVGLCEAESCFLIRGRKNKEGEIVGFEFAFRIALHRDDRKVLEYIKCTLGAGRLNTERNTLVFTISQLSYIETILIPLFEQFPLNSTKHLDFLNFKKAFYMYKNYKTCAPRSARERKLLISDIIDLKNGMNDQRIDFDLPKDHRIRITGNYLAGFLEGDGSFASSPYWAGNESVDRGLLPASQDRSWLAASVLGPHFLICV